MPTAVEFGNGGAIHADIFSGQGGGSGFVLNLPGTSSFSGLGGGSGFTANHSTTSVAFGEGGGSGFQVDIVGQHSNVAHVGFLPGI